MRIMNEAIAYVTATLSAGPIQACPSESPGGHIGWWVKTPQGPRFVSNLELTRAGLTFTRRAVTL